MTGMPAEEIGIVPRVFDFIFEEIENRKRESEYNQFEVKVQFLEVYKEVLFDLLDKGTVEKNIAIREEKNGDIRIDGLKGEIAHNKADCTASLNKGIAARVVSSTAMNSGSSRSHAIFTVTIE